MLIDLQTVEQKDIHPILTQLVIPRPVAWVLSENPAGDYNLAPYSFFNVITSKPPILMVSVGRKPTDGAFKDTRVNIEQRKHFIVHIGHSAQAQAMTESSRHLDHGESELNKLDLKLEPEEGFPLPRLEDAPIAMYCELREIIEMGDAPQSLVFGNIKKIHVADRVCTTDAKGRQAFDAKAIDPLSRLGGADYGTLGEIITVPRPD